MLDRIVMYLVQARYYLESSLAISMGIFLVALLLMWIISRYGLKRKMKISIKNMIITYLLLLYIIVILKVTGILGMTFKIQWFLEAIKYCEISVPFVGSSILMVTLNLLLFVPLGFLIPAVFKKINFNYKKVSLSGCVFSCSIEFLQLFAGRFFEIDDIIANTLGTLIGYLFWQSFNGMRDKRTRGQALIKGMVTILSTISLIFCLSLVANNDFITREGDENFTTVLKYENKEYPFIMNEDVYEMMDTLY